MTNQERMKLGQQFNAEVIEPIFEMGFGFAFGLSMRIVQKAIQSVVNGRTVGLPSLESCGRAWNDMQAISQDLAGSHTDLSRLKELLQDSNKKLFLRLLDRGTK